MASIGVVSILCPQSGSPLHTFDIFVTNWGGGGGKMAISGLY